MGGGKPDGKLGALLSQHTTIGIGGAAPALFFPRSAAEVRGLLAESPRGGILVLGGGSNLLVSDAGVREPVMCLRKHMAKVVFSAGGSVVAEAGAMLPRTAVLCALSGLSGFEELAGIPGTVGGALVMNAGAFGREIGETVEWVEVADFDGALHRVEASAIRFGYRRAEYPVAGAIVRAAFRLPQCPPESAFGRMKELNARRRETQPWGERTFGSAFLRPAQGPSAGELLDRAGMKGFRVGDAAFSRKHANFVVNLGKATASDVFRLMEAGREAVRKAFGTALESEVRTWGEIDG